MQNNNLQNNSNFKSNEDETFDMKIILRFLLRNKKLVGYVSSVFLLFASFYSFTIKKTWQGEFQIVIKTESPQKNLMLNPLLQRFSQIANLDSSNDLNTEVGILESPSILMPIFEYVKNQKFDERKKNKDFEFSDWKKYNLKISLKEGTSILNIAYRDEKKELINPVLEKISDAYQTYSGRNKKRSILLTKNYLKNQINIYKEKSSKSIKIAQEFAIDQDLDFPDFETKDQNLKTNSYKETSQDDLGKALLIPNIGIENVRVKAANDIRRINSQIDKIKEIGDDYEQLQYIGTTVPALVEEDGFPQSLNLLENKLVELRAKYTENDSSIIRLLQRRDLLIDLLKNRAIGILNAEKIVAESKLKGATRPKGVLLEYKELIRNAQRDESTLVTLENQYRLAELESARSEDPWELITDPTLLSYPVAPLKKRIAFFGLIIGFILSSSIAIYKERRSGIIFELENLKKFTDNIFQINDLNNNQTELSMLNLLIDFIQNKKGNKVCILPLKNSNKSLLEILINKLSDSKQIKSLKNISYSDNDNEFDKFVDSDIRIIVGSMCAINCDELNLIKKRLEIYQKDLSAFIVLDK